MLYEVYEVLDNFEAKLKEGWSFIVDGKLVYSIAEIIEALQNRKFAINIYPELKIVEFVFVN